MPFVKAFISEIQVNDIFYAVSTTGGLDGFERESSCVKLLLVDEALRGVVTFVNTVSNSSEEKVHRSNFSNIPSVSIEKDFFIYKMLLQLSINIKVSLCNCRCILNIIC